MIMKKIFFTILFILTFDLSAQVMFSGIVASSLQTTTEYLISDDFDSYSTGDIHGQGDWLDGNSGDPHMRVVDVSGDKRVTGEVDDECMAYYNITASNDHKVELTIEGTGSSGNYVGVAVRCSSGMTYYGLYVRNDYVYFFIMQSGSFSNLINGQSVTINSGDVIGLSVDGTTLTCYKNGSVWTELGSALSPATGNNGVYTDTRISSGKPGICAYGSGNTAQGDNFNVTEL